MRSQARVAVVLPCYQSARYLPETVASVRAQTLADWRMVVVDDGSTDHPAAAIEEVLAGDRRIQFVRQENQGVASARNTGARLVGPSDYVLFLDADDVLEPAMLESLVAWLDSHQHAGIAYCKPSFIDERGRSTTCDWAPRLRPGKRGIEVIAEEERLTPFVSVFCLAGIVPSLALIRRPLFDAVGGFEESFGQHYEDTLLFLKVALRAEIHYLPRELVRHRRHGGQSTADVSKFSPQEQKLYGRFRDLSSFPPEQAEIIREAWRFRERRLIPRRAWEAAARETHAGSPLKAARFLAGAVRIVTTSLVAGPGKARS